MQSSVIRTKYLLSARNVISVTIRCLSQDYTNATFKINSKKVSYKKKKLYKCRRYFLEKIFFINDDIKKIIPYVMHDVLPSSITTFL